MKTYATVYQLHLGKIISRHLYLGTAAHARAALSRAARKNGDMQGVYIVEVVDGECQSLTEADCGALNRIDHRIDQR